MLFTIEILVHFWPASAVIPIAPVSELCKASGIILLEQCREMTKSAVKSDKSFGSLEKADDVVGLLNLIRDLCYETNKKRCWKYI